MTTATVPGLGNTLAAEWTKIRSVRSTWVVVVAALVVSVGFSVLFAFLTEQDYQNLPADQRTNFDAAGTTLVGMNLGLIIIAVLGVLATSARLLELLSLLQLKRDWTSTELAGRLDVSTRTVRAD
ncbi:HTH domain-containing protein, partial [Kibdelosporangium lantanae]